MNEITKPAASSTTSDYAASAGAATRPRCLRAVLTGGVLAAAALLVVGGSAYALGGSEDDLPGVVAEGSSGSGSSDPGSSDSGSAGSGSTAADGTDDRDDDADDAADDASDAAAASGAALPAADAGSLRTAAESAIGEVSGTGITAIDVERGGYEVEVVLTDGTDVDAFIAADGAVTADAPESDDDGDQDPVLDLTLLEDIESAARTASADAGYGELTLESIGSSDHRGIAYEVSFRSADGHEVEVDLAADLSVLDVDRDDD